VLLACWAIPLGLGALAGIGDALYSWATGTSVQKGAALFLYTVSFGAAAAFAAALPLTLLFAVFARWLTPATRMAGTLAALCLSFPALHLVRSVYQRAPWNGGDLAFGALGALGLLAAAIVGTWLTARVLCRFEGRLVRSLARASVPLLFLLLPITWLVAAGLRPDRGARADDTASGSNLLLLTVDTLRADRIGAYGDPEARTPWIDRLSRRGTTWSDCLAPSPWTLPSLGTLLTGTYPGEHHVLEEVSSLAENVTSLAEIAREAHYRTAAIVTNPWMSAGALSRGFDHFDLAERFESFGPLHGTRLYGTLARKLARALQLDRADRTTARALEWLGRTNGNWLLWVHYLDPHIPNWPGPPWDRLFGPPPRLVGRWMPIRKGAYAGGVAAEGGIRRLYSGEVAFTDANLGPIFRELEQRGALATTTIVFSSDHGEELWDHGGYEHGHAMFDELVRVPFFVVPPGGGRGHVSSSLVRLVDLAPTALGVLGFGPREEFTGVDVTGVPEGVPATFGEGTLYGNEQKYLRVGRWKLVYEPALPEAEALRLYDLAADPGEMRDLAGAEPARTDSLFTLLRDWMDRVGSDTPMAARATAGELDPAVRAQLEALGYFGGD
jgi:arylsulfatase A-like enzyme